MKIRSITCFINPGWPLDWQIVEQAGRLAQHARTRIEAAGYVVQTTRLATLPFPQVVGLDNLQGATRLASELEEMSRSYGFDHFCIGPALAEAPDSYAVIPEILAAAPGVFVGGMLTTSGGSISLQAARACAQVIWEAARLTSDGFANLRFAALANVPAGAPFFPAAYHRGGPLAFAFATEAADLAVTAFRQAGSLEQARVLLIRAVEAHAAELTSHAEDIARQFGCRFGGIDFTLAPFPQVDLSIGTAIEALGAPAVGLSGSLAAAAFLTDTLDRARYPRAGFNGLFLPVLEDTVLAQRAAQGALTVQDLLLYSAVCGTGLDTVPLPGEVSAESLSAVLLDLAALAVRLDKPLTARLMPVPGKAAGDSTSFDFAFFTNSRVLGLAAQPLSGLFSGGETIELKRRSGHWEPI